MFGSEGSPIVQYVVIFAVIFTALAAIVFTVRRLTGRSLTLPGRTPARGRQPRLGIVDVYELDRARQLILLRRDNVEHLLLVGGPNDVVVERNIQRSQRPMPEATLRADGGSEPLAEPLPDPMAQGGRLAEPPRALAEIAGRRSEPLFDPGFEMPVVVPPPVPRSGAAPPVTFPLDVNLLGGDEPGQEVSTPALLQPRAAEPVPPVLRDTLSPRRILSRTAPPLAEPRLNPASERKFEPAPEPISEPATEPAPQPFRPAPSLNVPSERRTVDPAVLSDMARQLQAALSRPASAVTPAPLAPAPEPVDPVAAMMAAAPPPPASPPPPAPPVAPPPAPRMPSPPPELPPIVPPTPEPPAPRPTAPVASPAPAPPTAPPAPPRPEPKTAGNPFSVEEIEAEFARLLGRPLDKRS
ncbi:hypothetical protein MKL09_20625 [Methylobacterium sp. J-048]|uniref:hypothetical protein n=1 Tax=Methylobacterium sp. J-048 TaxID=2836635 RepID=UPI001FBBAEA8|nr:hypothetical protein [Methylobacterium sp. J-048]MCJ2058940.1 hypothetical protein [Methylobacterium sp. J-048]